MPNTWFKKSCTSCLGLSDLIGYNPYTPRGNDVNLQRRMMWQKSKGE